jgi:hypothetical protein
MHDLSEMAPNRLPGFPDTVNLKANIHTRAAGVSPLVELEPTEHPLAIALRQGISKEDCEGLVLKLRHG